MSKKLLIIGGSFFSLYSCWCGYSNITKYSKPSTENQNGSFVMSHTTFGRR